MNLSDITKINFGAANISAVYNGGIKLWPTGSELSNKVMKFTVVSGDTWEKTGISAFTADNKYITPIKKDATGWTYDEEVEYFDSDRHYYYHGGTNLLTFEGFPKSVKFKSGVALFYNNYKCTDISTANMDTSECTNMNSMFSYCESLASLDVSNFNTSQVTDMYKMFTSCGSLTSLDLSNFNTSQVTNMSYMFNSCRKLTSLDLTNFDTSKVTDMSFMFYSCGKLTSLDLSNWDMTKVTNTGNMFYNSTSLQTVKMTNCNQDTKDKIRAALDAAGLTNTVITE